jgi:16S rRNA processing protein RimM
MPGKPRLKIGRVLGPHGVKGAVRLHVMLESPEAIGTLGGIQDAAGKPVRLTLVGVSGKALIARIVGVETREDAEALGKAELFVERDALPALEADEFYAADLVGLVALDEAGGELGKVIAVVDFGAGPLLEIRPAAGGTSVYLPFTAAVVPEVDIEAGRVRIALMPGLWPER